MYSLKGNYVLVIALGKQVTNRAYERKPEKRGKQSRKRERMKKNAQTSDISDKLARGLRTRMSPPTT